MRILTAILALALNMLAGGQTYLKQLQPRDSILIADQLEYGFEMDSVKVGTSLALPDFSAISNDTLTLVRQWNIDTLKVYGKRKSPEAYRIRAGIILSPFEEGEYALPPIPVLRQFGERVDTLIFDALEMSVKTMPVDTASFEIHDIKGQIRYPLTFRELAPWIAVSLLAIGLLVLLVLLIVRRKRRNAGLSEHVDPPYIVALRRLDQFRGDKFWAPEKQKAMYSGITDALKDYIDASFGIDAPEMTTAELFSALKSEKNITPELWTAMKELFECADFVKFAKFHASDEENAKALPVAVRFVTETYRSDVEDESAAVEDKEASSN